MDVDPIVRRASEAFNEAASVPPPLTLRGANALDGYDRPEPYDAAVDSPTDEYLEGRSGASVIWTHSRGVTICRGCWTTR